MGFALKRYKAPNPNEQPPAIFKDGGPSLVQLTTLLQEIWVIPSGWSLADIVPVFKKGTRTDCANHRGIRLICVASKFLATLLLLSFSQVREQSILEEQAGFRSSRSCIDHIYTLRQIRL
ncbi:unnamed protein product [Dicrocoelium dendriticum]|nr:unnamed protein product [Dicrocoelium dendriticum]